MPDWIYRYPPLEAGTLLKRYKRFLADIQLQSGEVITAHCPNTGPMIGVCTPGSPVQVSRSDNPKRKLAYTWEMIQVNDTQPTWVGVNTGLPNRVIKLALEQHLIPELANNYSTIRTEVPYGKDKKSRVDFLLSSDRSSGETSQQTRGRGDTETRRMEIPGQISLTPEEQSLNSPIYVEVKSATLAEGKVALFPDTVTTRGQKHLRELTALLPQ
ncbi:MAG: DNA/RNA nuclease SfsA, partial [Symploca sp. SIO3E6]|nr:DNA/RNA nuclease SfsA [Caldora sp. SIO3E6]